MNPSATISNDQPIVRASKRKSSTKKTGAVKKACVEASTSTGKKPQKKRDRFYQRPGSQLSLRCEPLEIFDEALVKLKEKLPEGSEVKCEEGGVVLITFSNLFVKNRDVINSEKWMWLQNQQLLQDCNPSFSVQKMMSHLQLTTDEKEIIPLVNWMYGFHGSSVFRCSDKRVFLLLTGNSLSFLGLVKNKNVSRTLENIHKIDPEHILIFDYSKIFGLNELPDLENNIIFNKLDYIPAAKKVLAVEKGYILKALKNCTTDRARSLGDIMAMICEYMIAEAAQSHAEAVGEEEFERAVVAPAQEDLKLQVARLAAEKRSVEEENSKLRYDFADANIGLRIREEKISELKGEVLKQELENAKSVMIRYESMIKLQNEMEEREKETRCKEIALFEKDKLECKMNRHLELNLPIRPIGSRMDVNQHEHRGAVIIYSTNQRPQEKMKLEEGEEILQIKFITRTDFNKKKQEPLQKIVTSLIGSAKDFSLYKTQGVENIKKVHLILFGGIENLQTRTIFRDEIIQRAVEPKQSARFNSVGIVNSSTTEDVINRLMRERLPLLFVAGFSTNNLSFVNLDMGETSYSAEDMDYINDFDFEKFCARASYASE
ncbi:hypothetical protein AbHV_ORF21 [Abalone herpesvirus Victoria/AUS/2009]|uniref:Uncharacterized protein n=1 Tax=Abalone herpesvirus (isolate Abalone/Australia/Victoria/2009) TaxID=1241371 RepID=K4JV24_ABHV|nr:hypothetical protein AbHV_ORF21 [Abalone herpesvirus Victoria/AUS/2009]AFU90031.1 hypothetical protein AbHV_ORF21 [Abalone herpesvirus Victoria/AUS/2009]